jgi:hypothetical protein
LGFLDERKRNSDRKINLEKGEFTMFDIYMYRGYKTAPDFGELFKVIQVKDKGEFLLNLKREKPGFLGLNLSYKVAKEVLVKLINLELTGVGVNGQVYPVRYRDKTPKFSVETAYPIATKAITEMQAKYPNISFSPIVYAPAYSSLGELTFMSTSKEWTQEGEALFVNIDILDGHIWTDDEMEKWTLED